MPRTTSDLDPSVLQELRRRGERERKPLGQVASELLASALAEPGPPAHAPAFTWRSADLGVPLEDKEAVHRVLVEPP